MRCCEGLPQQVWPDFGLGAQALDRVVEDLDQLGRAELAEGGAARRHHVDLRLFHLDHRAAGIGELVQFLVERVGQRHGALDRVLVIDVGHGRGQEFGQDGAELDRLPGETLRGFPHRGVLQVAAADRAHHLRQHPRLERIVQDVAAREADGA
jgi:hypothetical protein